MATRGEAQLLSAQGSFYFHPGCQRTPLCLRQAAPVEAQCRRRLPCLSAGSGRRDTSPGAGFLLGTRCSEMAIHQGSQAGPCVRASCLSLTATFPTRGRDPSKVLQSTAGPELGHLTSGQHRDRCLGCCPRTFACGTTVGWPREMLGDCV